MKKFLFFSFLFNTLGSLAQDNLVPNPSFEDTILYRGGYSVKGWRDNIGSPDYFGPYNTSSSVQVPVNARGTQIAQNGTAYFGFGVLTQQINFREYLQTPLSDSLKKGEQYKVQFYLSLADSFHWAVDYTDIAFVFFDTLTSNTGHDLKEFRPYYISDTAWDAANKVGWEKFQTTYTAEGGEQALIIGSFKKDADLSLDSVGNGGDFPLAYNGSYYYIDNISVRYIDTAIGLTESRLQQSVRLYPNPVKEYFSVENNAGKPLQYRLYNALGQEQRLVSLGSQNFTSTKLTSGKLNSRDVTSRDVTSSGVTSSEAEKVAVFSISHLPKGLYILQLSDGKQQASFKLLKE